MAALASQTAVENAYRTCEQITGSEAKNFAYGIRLLPAAKRKALSAVYAFARRVDDIGDGEYSAERKLAELERVRSELHSIGAPGEDKVLVALADAAWRFELPLPAFDELIDGCRADVLGEQYPDFASLHRYCRCVAGSIGRLSLAVFGCADKEWGEPVADALGVALQLTNILRDVLEDRRAGRIYLPACDLDHFGVTLGLSAEGAGGGFVEDEHALAALICYEGVRAREWYADGLRLLPALDHRSRACAGAMAGIYHRLLGRIMARPWQVLGGRMSLSTGEKLAVASRALSGVGL
jgi:phytoene synthase